MRFRDNAEGIALYGGEADEKRGLRERFGAVMGNWWALMVATKRLTALVREVIATQRAAADGRTDVA